MGQVSPKLRRGADGRLFFYCPGCDEIHQVNVGEGAGPRWTFDGNLERPTFMPSVLVTYRHPKGFTNDNPAPAGWHGEYVNEICHTFVRDGRIQFLGDCTHAMAGQTVDLPDLPEAYSDANFHGGDS